MEKNKETKTLSPKLDVVFQALFGEIGNERITKGFLETILKRKIESIDLSKNPILRREFKDDKLGVLDILAELDGKEKCNIEMQLIDQSNIIERILYYWSRLYTRQIKTGEDYSLLEKTIVILITDFEVKNLKEMDYHSVWKIMDNKTGGKILTDKLEIDIIELPKIKGREKEKDKLLDWLYFLENPKSERVTEKMGENKEIKEATEKLDSLSEDERMQRIADLRLKAIMDEKAIYAKGLEDGERKREEELKERIEELRQKAIMDEKAIYAKGLEDGERKREEELKERMEELRQKAIMDEKAIYAKGLEDGERKREEELKERMEELRQKAIMDEKATYAKGLEKGKLEVAKKMLELKISKETIAKATGLTIQEIENISN
jgi:predicted transposase/invertase (TIGR01784 family)